MSIDTHTLGNAHLCTAVYNGLTARSDLADIANTELGVHHPAFRQWLRDISMRYFNGESHFQGAGRNRSTTLE